MRLILVPALACAALAGCTGNRVPAGAPAAPVALDPGQLAKTDIDRVAEAHRREAFASLRVLAEKLYRRNPREWKKGGHASLDAALARLFGATGDWRLREPDGRRGTEAILLALSPDYAADRVAAFIAGLGGMMHAGFDDKTEFFVTDDLDAQKLYNCARNVELAAWKLAQARGSDGLPLLLANEMGSVPNLSFEREFGKLIGNFDLLSKIVADKTQRTIVKVIQSMATAVFLPVPALK